MMRDITIGEKIGSASDMAGDIIWKAVRVKNADYKIGFYVNNETGYQVLDQVMRPLLDQFTEDLDDV
jgi:hypothetical protein